MTDRYSPPRAPLDEVTATSRRTSVTWPVQLFTLPAWIILGTVAYGWATSRFAAAFFPRVFPRPYVEMLGADVAGALAPAALVAWPLARLYGPRAWIVALVVAAPMMALRVSWLVTFAGEDQPGIMITSAFELVTFPVSLLAGVAFVRWMRARGARTSATRTPHDDT